MEMRREDRLECQCQLQNNKLRSLTLCDARVTRSLRVGTLDEACFIGHLSIQIVESVFWVWKEIVRFTKIVREDDVGRDSIGLMVN